MTIANYGWTKPISTANLLLDPSGIQDAGTTWQAVLLPGLTTVTVSLRYLTLFAAARYWRMNAGASNTEDLALDTYWRRLEALIALCSLAHHQENGDPPTGIIGRNYADNNVDLPIISLKTNLQIPPYRIYRATLGALGIFDLGGSDPMFEVSKTLGASWDISSAGEIGTSIQNGQLPEVVNSADLAHISQAFCLCKIPDESNEQKALISLLLGMDNISAPPKFSEKIIPSQGLRIATWRLLLEIIRSSPGVRLNQETLMARILDPTLMELPRINRNTVIKKTLLVWRCIAARTFFERGWTQIFAKTFTYLRPSYSGETGSELITAMEGQYLEYHDEQSVEELTEEVKSLMFDQDWLIEKFNGKTLKDHLCLLIAGLLTAKHDISTDLDIDLDQVHESGAITTNSEERRYLELYGKQSKCSEYLASTAHETLLNHYSIGLRKLQQGNPDSLHIDYENGRWVVPTKAIKWNPSAAGAASRLDVALGWAQQLGLVEPEQGGLILTALGTNTLDNWDEAYKSWE